MSFNDQSISNEGQFDTPASPDPEDSSSSDEPSDENLSEHEITKPISNNSLNDSNSASPNLENASVTSKESKEHDQSSPFQNEDYVRELNVNNMDTPLSPPMEENSNDSLPPITETPISPKALSSDSNPPTPLQDDNPISPEVENPPTPVQDELLSEKPATENNVNISDAAKMFDDLDQDSDESLDEPFEDAATRKRKRALLHSDDEADDDDEKNADEPLAKEGRRQATAELIADIFGQSDEDSDFEGFQVDDVEKKNLQVQQNIKKEMQRITASSDEEDVKSDWDLMMERRKALQGTRRRNLKDSEIINDQDDKITALMAEMKEALEEDKILNKNKQAATKKLKLLPFVVKELNKVFLHTAFLENGMLAMVADWLSPLPDKSLPHLHIRTGLLKFLRQLPAIDSMVLKESGVGRAVMLLYKHPREVHSNKAIAFKLINDWARPIFGLTSNFSDMTKEERQDRDQEKMVRIKRQSSIEGNPTTETAASKPGDPGFIARARVPMPSTKDYVFRPKSRFDLDEDSSEFPKHITSKKAPASRIDPYMRKMKEKRSQSKKLHAVQIKLH